MLISAVYEYIYDYMILYILFISPNYSRRQELVDKIEFIIRVLVHY